MTGLTALRMDANIVVLGTDNVGKSGVFITQFIKRKPAIVKMNTCLILIIVVLALTVRFLTRRFIGEYGEIESIYSNSVIVDGRQQTVNIWDSPYSQEGMSPDSTTLEKRLQWADGFILVYSICDRASFNNISKLLLSIKATKDYVGLEKVPVVIVGNKQDLQHRRMVLSEEGWLLALSADCQFYEVSAAENYHSILMVFHGLVKSIRESRLAIKKPAGIKSIVKSVSAVFARRQTDSL
ncbi:hypothetical protein P4O66_018296 [Electrophorus voltai]|uniref:small monomeric GTPase n=1 Tax=Electrophorus voltai TaxID=2609070 RepID=A0AAD9DJJ9_9TELE|nr:hypothetical protein P4O66_018296 [Electrophorus voltai]